MFYSRKELPAAACGLQCLTGSKGFRQPVYVLDLKELGRMAFIPALAG